MSELWLMVGAPASGKTTYLAEHSVNGIVVSRDKIRFSMISDEDEYFSKEKEVFREFVRQIQEGLDAGKNVYADATNLHWASRRKLLFNLDLKNTKVCALVFDVPVETLLERNAARVGRAKVPESALINMKNSQTSPETDNFDYDKIIYRF